MITWPGIRESSYSPSVPSTLKELLSQVIVGLQRHQLLRSSKRTREATLKIVHSSRTKATMIFLLSAMSVRVLELFNWFLVNTLSFSRVARSKETMGIRQLQMFM